MMRIGVGLGVVAMMLGVSASAIADENAGAKAKEADATLEAKGEKKSELDDVAVGTEDLKAKKEKQVAQNASASGNARARGRQPEAADKPKEEKKPNGLPARIPWRGTAVSWGMNSSAAALGIGDDFQGSEFQAVNMTFGASINYFVIDQQKWSLALQTVPSFNVELTNSGTTTREREPWFNDLPLNVVYRRLLYADPDGGAWATGLVLRARAFLPTNPASYNAGTYLRTQPAVIMWQSLPGIPKDVAPVLNSWVVGAVANWTHRFGDSVTGVDRDLQDVINRAGNNSNGAVGAGDAALDQNIQLSGARLAENTLGQAVFLFLSQPIGPTMLQFSTGFSFSQVFQRPFDNTAVECPLGDTTGCDPDFANNLENNDARNVQYNYGFFFSGNFFPIPEAGVSFGYSSVGNQLAQDGQRENVFYTQRYANFNVGLAVSVDAIYEVLTGPRRSRPFMLVAKNNKKNDKQRTQPKKGIRNPTGL